MPVDEHMPERPPVVVGASVPSASSAAQTPPRAFWTTHLSLAPVILGLLTAMFYLNGRAFFLGYLEYFHLDSSMFSDDLSQQVSRSVAAWLYLSTDLAGWINAQFRWTLLWLFLIPVGGVIVLCIGAAVLRGLVSVLKQVGDRIASAVRPMQRHPQTLATALWIRRTFAPPRLVRPFLSGLATIYVAGYVVNLVIWIITLVLVVLVAPFDTVGKSVAAKDAANGFATNPTTFVENDDGTVSMYHLILCAPRYCALYDGSRAITVAASAVTRTDSPMPGRIRAAPSSPRAARLQSNDMNIAPIDPLRQR